MTDAERATLYFTQEMMVTLMRSLASAPGLQPQAFKDMTRLAEKSVGDRFPDLRAQFAIHAGSVCDGIDEDIGLSIARKR